jgi:hypothetical protein
MQVEKVTAEDMCGPCNSRRASASKLFGKWPIESFKKLPEELQTEFWKGDGVGKDGVLEALAKTISSHRINTHTDMNQGQYLPLSVYERQGYDVERIKKECVDTEEHGLLGTTYRVDIHAIGSGEIKNEVEKELIDLAKVGGKRGRSVDKKKRQKKTSKKARKASSSTSSTSSSSGGSQASKTSKTALEKKAEAPGSLGVWILVHSGVNRLSCTPGNLGVWEFGFWCIAVSTACHAPLGVWEFMRLEFQGLEFMCLEFMFFVEFKRLEFMCLEFMSLEFMGLEFRCLEFGSPEFACARVYVSRVYGSRVYVSRI